MAERPTIIVRGGLGIASVMARQRVDPAAIGAVLGADMPQGPRAALTNGRAIVGTGPGTWLVVTDDAGHDHAERLAESLAGLAAVSDQSGAYLVQRISGASARVLLQRGAGIDVHPQKFATGSAATTVIAQIGVVLWQVDDAPSYDLAVFRSYVGSFRYWLDQCLAAL